MTPFYLLEPSDETGAWAPFAGVRPVAELRAGAWLVRERWEASVGRPATAVVSDELTGFVDVGTAPVVGEDAVLGPALVVRSDFIPARAAIAIPEGTRTLKCEGAVVGFVLAKGESLSSAQTDGVAFEVAGRWLAGTCDLLLAVEELLPADCEEFTLAGSDPVREGAIVLGDPARLVSLGALVEPGVVFDLREGAVVLAEGSEVRSGTRLEGPVYVGPETVVLGGRIRGSSFGPQCRIHGEVSASVFVGYANKSHDGFVGHSVVGPWVNVGAGTITSNLKNTYGPVRLDLPQGRMETGRTFVGSLIGDHAKTAIGTTLATGSVIGAGANVFGPGEVPRFVPPFAWGSSGIERLNVTGFVRIAQRVMPRRGVEVTPAIEASLRSLHARFSP